MPLSLKEDKDIVCAIGNNGKIRHIYGPVRHLDVGSSQRGAEEGPKRLAVRQLK